MRKGPRIGFISVPISDRWKSPGVLLFAALLLAACGSGATSSGSSGGSLFIASSNPMTGNSGYYGEDKVRAIQLAVDEVNASGGVNGRKLELTVNDDGGDPSQGASLAARECADQSILAVIGHWNSSVSLAAAPIYKKCNLPNINDDTTQKLSGISPDTFRLFATGLIEGKYLAQYAYGVGYRRAAVLNDTNDYGLSLSNAFEQDFQQLGGQTVSTASYVEGDTNFLPEADKFKSANPDVIFIAGYDLETALASKAIRGLGMTQPIMGGDGIDAPQLIQIGGSAVEGIVFADDYSAQLKSTENQAFVQKWEQKYSSPPDTFAALAYDTTNLLIAAMKSGATTRSAIQQWLTKVKNFPGVTGIISFDSQHDAARSVYMLKVQSGHIVLNDKQVKNGQVVPSSEI